MAKLELLKQSLLRAKLEQADSAVLCQKVRLPSALDLLSPSSYLAQPRAQDWRQECTGRRLPHADYGTTLFSGD